MMCCKSLTVIPYGKQLDGVSFFKLPRITWEMNQKYLELHSVKRVSNVGRDVVCSVHGPTTPTPKGLLVYTVCKALEVDTGKCTLHGTPQKPRICVAGYTEQVENLLWFRECIYKNNAPVREYMISVDQIRR